MHITNIYIVDCSGYLTYYTELTYHISNKDFGIIFWSEHDASTVVEL